MELDFSTGVAIITLVIAVVVGYQGFQISRGKIELVGKEVAKQIPEPRKKDYAKVMSSLVFGMAIVALADGILQLTLGMISGLLLVPAVVIYLIFLLYFQKKFTK